MPGGGGGQPQIRLYRDSLSTSWGFRLYGGKDLNCPLTVQKVSPCSPAEGEVHTGDVLLEIQGNDASKMTHAQAQDLITKAGGSLLLRLSRGGGRVFIPSPQVVTPPPPTYTRLPPKRLQPTPMNNDFGVDYNRPKYLNAAPQITTDYYSTPSSFMLSRVNDSLSSSLRSSLSSAHSSPGYYSDYSPSYITPPTSWSAAPAKPYSPPAAPPAANSSTPWRRGGPSPAQRAVTDESPAWLGSLRSSSTPLASDAHSSAAPVHVPKVQGVHYGVDGRPEYRQRATDGAHADTATAAHLQYNSPLGLYSRQNVQEAMSAQIGGTAAEGTIGITTETEVQKMLRDEESGRRGGRRGPNPPVDTSVYQSPSVRALEAQLGVKHEEVGLSDF